MAAPSSLDHQYWKAWEGAFVVLSQHSDRLNVNKSYEEEFIGKSAKRTKQNFQNDIK
jgi:hypothetical protein